MCVYNCMFVCKKKPVCVSLCARAIVWTRQVLKSSRLDQEKKTDICSIIKYGVILQRIHAWFRDMHLCTFVRV